MKRKIIITIGGYEGDYWKYTLIQWINEIKDIIEKEYEVSVEVKSANEDVEMPILYIDGIPVMIGVPGEEGYLIEIIKKFLNNYLITKA